MYCAAVRSLRSPCAVAIASAGRAPIVPSIVSAAACGASRPVWGTASAAAVRLQTVRSLSTVAPANVPIAMAAPLRAAATVPVIVPSRPPARPPARPAVPLRATRIAVAPARTSRWSLRGLQTSSSAKMAAAFPTAGALRAAAHNAGYGNGGRRASWRMVMSAGLAAGILATLTFEDMHAKACGIVGFIGKEPAVNFLMEGLTILQNRGYDSAGVATLHLNNGKMEVATTKFASAGTSDSVSKLKNVAPTNHAGDLVGISHTRWATHGGKTDENAHPHSDSKGRLALVHNGTIENSSTLKAELEARGIEFKSQTDTEVIVQLIGTFLDENISLVDAVKKALGRLEGTWGICVISRDHPDQIIAARNGSPLVIGIDESQNRMFVASEPVAFARHTNSYIALSDGEVAVIKVNGTDLDLSRVERSVQETIELSPGAYPNWTIKEIMEQPEAIARTLNYGGRFTADGIVKLGGLQANAELLLGIRNLSIAACGTSLFAGMYGARLMRWLACFDTVNPVDAAEVVPETIPMYSGGMLVISQSGETKDTHRALMHAEAHGIPRFSVVNQVGSLIARSTKCGVYINAGREHAVASTKAFTTQVAALSLVAGWFAQNREKLIDPILNPNSIDMSGPKTTVDQRRAELIESVHRLPTYSGMTLRTHEKCKAVAAKLKDKEHIFVLGKGFAEPIAYEGALKIKEIGYTHAEGYSGGALKHGPFALLENGTPVILLILDDQHGDLMRTAAHETKARGAYNIVITDNPKLAQGVAHDTITIPSNGPLTALLGVLPLQMIAYEMAMAKGITVDTPRNLAKAVTVD